MQDLRRADPKAKLAAAAASLARDHGLSPVGAPSGRNRSASNPERALFFEACTQGEVEELRGLLANDRSLARLKNADRFGATGLHPAAGAWARGCRRLLLRTRGSERTRSRRTPRVHWLAARTHSETGRALLDAGGDVTAWATSTSLTLLVGNFLPSAGRKSAATWCRSSSSGGAPPSHLLGDRSRDLEEFNSLSSRIRRPLDRPPVALRARANARCISLEPEPAPHPDL